MVNSSKRSFITYLHKLVYMPYIVGLIAIFFTSHAHASSQDEIHYLLNYVSQTPCQFERNGSQYQGKDAVKHIQKKYRYYQDDIATAEDFIRYAATKSSMSGKYYLIHCPNQATSKSQDWLLQALNHYRSTKK